MNVKLGALGIGVLFFTGMALTQAQTKRKTHSVPKKLMRSWSQVIKRKELALPRQ